ncbi:hypothetical protein CkaCkLH20_08424 [Colletotrichum karsti]|uniref:Uncharacterized protein n=1 Tax=Colletotrichum karsti TaxID=1095194 RepID=A0A9P6LIX4_9PEZI|nr:uncharacterized protein CkaCkLH20_08424 [Colletotrichum karsti]KAF9874052.1 hypothetical protein CkaCkLH20_08424 [Colletotrichum karsti]
MINNKPASPTPATTIRRTVPWNTEDLIHLTLQDLRQKHRLIKIEVSCLKHLLNEPSDDTPESPWHKHGALAGWRGEIAPIQGHAVARREVRDGCHDDIESIDDWYRNGHADRFLIKRLACQQIEEIARRQAGSPPDTENTRRQEWELRQLFDLSLGGIKNTISACGDEISQKHKRMQRQMVKRYCPNHRFKDQSSTELYTPFNGLFLDNYIRKGIEEGIIAIVPDVGLEPGSSEEEQKTYNKNLNEWKARSDQDYKIIVTDPDHPSAVTIKSFSLRHPEFERLTDFDGRKLMFQTDFRPRRRYLWWMFLSSVAVASWRRRDRNGSGNIIDDRIRKAFAYWGSPGVGQVNPDVMRSFVRAIGGGAERCLNRCKHRLGDHHDLGVSVVAFDRQYPVINENYEPHVYYSDDDDDMFA